MDHRLQWNIWNTVVVMVELSTSTITTEEAEGMTMGVIVVGDPTVAAPLLDVEALEALGTDTDVMMIAAIANTGTDAVVPGAIVGNEIVIETGAGETAVETGKGPGTAGPPGDEVVVDRVEVGTTDHLGVEVIRPHPLVGTERALKPVLIVSQVQEREVQAEAYHLHQGVVAVCKVRKENGTEGAEVEVENVKGGEGTERRAASMQEIVQVEV
mmetsp:Transcript_13420/g.18965  ORF Transcript_13420/g.18965 Transcript_13420/m.18965 type:complete len:213 (+) Transcript_13420:164-802(+)